MSPRLISAPAAEARQAAARSWLESRAAGEEVLVVAATADAANELLRGVARSRGAAFGWHRATFARLAASLAAESLARVNEVPVSRLVAQAVVARVVHEADAEGRLGRYEHIAGGPGLVRALAGALEELRLAGADGAGVAAVAPELAGILEAYDAALREAGLADRARVFELASDRARDATSHPWLGLPTLLLDVPIGCAREAELALAFAARAPELLATLPTGDAASEAALCVALGLLAPEQVGDPRPTRELWRLQHYLFSGAGPSGSDSGDAGESDESQESQTPTIGDGISVVSAPGESRECVEIARRIHRLADAGTPFDAIGILLRSPDEYRPHLVEALRRAGIPAHFARGAVQPDPAGRAFIALLACAAEDLSARRFAEYVSLGEVPDAKADGAPPAPAPRSERWVAPDEEMVSEVVAQVLEAPGAPESGSADAQQTDPDAGDSHAAAEAPVRSGRLRAPRRWERLLVDAAVIGGRDRWERRLDGLANELGLDLDATSESDDPVAGRIRQDLADLATLRGFALPLLDELAGLPASARWGDWLDALSALATRSLRRPERVLAVLAELAPMASVGPVGLSEVQLVLSRRLLELASPPSAARYGRVFVAPIEAARGLVFDVVFVPGLAEKLFPRKLGEEPILLDAARESIGSLPTRKDRLDAERLLLRIAVGAAKGGLVISYPRLDLDQSRPRVPSVYALEAMYAATGRLPGFDELARGAERVGAARVGWPAPADRADAIDDAEHDLALLESLQGPDSEKDRGTARYLLTANPHLGRALRFRARRWLKGWTVADGLCKPSEAAKRAIEAHGLAARSFSPTALQNYAACPYKFFLYAVHRLAPRDVPEAIEQMQPLERGSMVHEMQFELFGILRDEGLLPVTEKNLDAARVHLDRVVGEVSLRYRDELAPAIDRVWDDGVQGVKSDLREWLRRASLDESGFVPWRFELSFGLKGRRDRDPHSSEEHVSLDCGLRLRGSIDLIERSEDGRVRATDHKTGKERFKPGEIVARGEALQPVLYALAAEKLFPEETVESGRLYYCTAAGGFEERTVPLDDAARKSAQTVADVIGQALGEPFLPAAPAEGACRWCDYQVVCGPYEELRTGRKWQPPLETLKKLRNLT